MNGQRRALFLASVSEEPADWRPSADLYRTTFGWVLKVDLAGVRPEDVTVELRGSEVVLRGTRRDRPPPGWEVYSMEICYSRFERRFRLPCQEQVLAGAEVEARAEHGMLYVQLSIGGGNR